ncbi:S-layer protein [Paenarthrobacter sp. MSM-2-10-13]|uniref:Ig domain-containing protein n=1 Tax=Paenarthrobacter sp. MSM-2-10-13 TaxID=2717318 RepID=UPI00141EAED6|nr:Ig domain-containing protein [Paenarthrobacter sp. MSM-2-10-13]NHW47369.1 S-layer protein [Paenarthrobacter sp. MSM-2-10-13]
MMIGLVPASAAPADPAAVPAASTQTQPDSVAQNNGPSFPAPATSPFADVSTSQQFYAEMAWLAGAGVSTGWSEANGSKTYRALQAVNRDAMAAFMYRLSGSPGFVPPAESPFADVSTSQQFYKEMAWLASKGISTGWTEADGFTKTYRALQPVNRDAMAAFLYRLAGSPDYTPPAVSPFADVSTSQQFYKEMAWLASSGISTGWTEANGSKTYRALQAVNRDAMAAFMYRFHLKTSPLTISNDHLMDGIAGVTYLEQLTGAGGFGSLTWSASGLPEGVTLSPTGILSGSPTATGDYPVSVTATDDSGMKLSRTLNLSVPEAAPEECAGKACEILVPQENTVRVPGDNIVAINRDPESNQIVSVELTSIDVTAGQVLTLDPWANLESGAILYVNDVQRTADGTLLVSVSTANLSAAYSEGTVHFTDPAAVATSLGESEKLSTPFAAKDPVPAPKKIQCEGGATADLKGLSVTPDMKPSLYADWKPFFSGLHQLQANIEGSITVNLGAAVSGEGICTLTGPEVKVTVPSGVGAIVMTAQPSLTFEVNGKLDLSTSVTLQCGTSYQWRDGKESRAATCGTEHEPLGLSSDSGIDATLTGAIDTRVTWVEIVGITGQINASVSAGYHPTEDPMAELKGRVGFELGACLVCFFDGGPHVTIYSGTIYEKTIASWSTKPPAPGTPDPEVNPAVEPLKVLSASLPSATVGRAYKIALAAKGGTPPYTWTISKGTLPSGLALNPGTGIVAGVPTAVATVNITVTATDKSGAAASAPLALVVNPTPPRGNKVLVYADGDEGYGIASVAKTLRDTGAEVVEATVLPEDLSGYKSIWNPSRYGWSDAEERRVASFIADGGAAYLTGERPCCEALNASVQSVLQEVLVDQNVVVGRMGDVQGTFTFNPAATNEITKVPNVLSTFAPDAPGAITGMAGVDARNVFARSESVAIGGVWSEGDMKTGRGRVVVLMDINYLEYDARTPIIQNVQHFLSKTP